MQELARQNPRLVAQINDNQAEFLQLLNEPGAAGVSELASELASQFGGGANEAPQGGAMLSRVPHAVDSCLYSTKTRQPPLCWKDDMYCMFAEFVIA